MHVNPQRSLAERDLADQHPMRGAVEANPLRGEATDGEPDKATVLRVKALELRLDREHLVAEPLRLQGHLARGDRGYASLLLCCRVHRGHRAFDRSD